MHEIAKEKDLLVIEDSAHALGAKYKSSKIGSCKYSDMVTLSFHPVKSITAGEGGAVLTNDKDIYADLLMYRSHGITKDLSHFKSQDPKKTGPWWYEMQGLGFNYRITDLQCALGLSQLKKLESFIDKRRRIADIYYQEMDGIGWIDLPKERPDVKSALHLYALRLKDPRKRRLVFEKLKKAGLGVQVHYIPVYWHPYYQQLGYPMGLCPKAEKFYQQEITIPLHPSMTKDEVEYVVKTVRSIKIKKC